MRAMRLSAVRVLVPLSLGCAVVFAYACSSTADNGPEDGTPDGAAGIDGNFDDVTSTARDGASDADRDTGVALDGSAFDADGAAVADADAGQDGDAAATPWRTVLGQAFNVNEVLTTPSGVTYIVGSRVVSSALRGVVVRLLANGAVDTAFGTAGYADVVLSPTTANQPLRGVLQPNGQLVLVGVAYTTPWKLVLTRLDPAGAIDTTFGTAGLLEAHAGIGNDLPFGITLGPSGGFLFTGMAFGATNFVSEVVVGRVTASGSLDTTFDGDGLALTSVGGRNSGKGIGLVSQNRVLVAAQSDKVAETLLLRFASDGSLDATFSTGQDAGSGAFPAGAGILRVASAANTSPEGMKRDSSGNWVVYGTGQVPGVEAGIRSAMVTVRVDENGTVDSTFHGSGGPYYATPTGSSFGLSFASQPSGKALLAGGVYEGPVAPFDSTKYWPGFVALGTSGSRDYSAFGLFTGLYVPHVYEGSDAVVAALPNGHFVAVASTSTSVEVFELVP
jgi:uncharacterized delta-60 repeat protein